MAQAFLNGTQYSDPNICEVATLIERTMEEIVVPEGVTVLGDCAFRGCNKLKKVTLPKGLKRIEAMAFYLIKALEEIEIPEGVEFIGGSVFSGCSNLAKVTLPESITAIGATAFNGTAITSFVYPDRVERIDDRIFLDCHKLESVVAPSACLHVEEYAFGKCPVCLTYDFTKCGAVPKLYDINAFENINSEARIYVPASLYEKWIAATNWSQVADHIMAIYTAPIVPTPDYISEGLFIEDGKLKGRGNCADSVIVVPDEVTRIISEALLDDTTLDTLILPERNKGVLIDDYSVIGSRLRVIKNFYETISTLSLYDCPLEVVSFLPSADWIYIGDFGSQVNPGVFDFTRHTSIPRLEIPEWFSYSIHEDTKILVPIELYDEWKADTNWTTLKQNIVCGKR